MGFDIKTIFDIGKTETNVSLEVEKYINKNISTPDAFIMLEKGKKIRRKVWKRGDYIKLNKVGRIVDKNNRVCPITLSMLYNDWEIVE